MATKLRQYIDLDPDVDPGKRDELEQRLAQDPEFLRKYIETDPDIDPAKREQAFSMFQSEYQPATVAAPSWGEVIKNVPYRAGGQILAGGGGALQAAEEALGTKTEYGKGVYGYGSKLSQPLPGETGTQQFVGDVLSNSLAMLPSMATGAGAAYRGMKLAATAIPLGYAAFTAGGSKYGQERELGADPSKAAAKAIPNAISEAAWEYPSWKFLLGSGGKGLAKRIWGMMAREAPTEFMTELTDQGADAVVNYIYDKNRKGLMPDFETDQRGQVIKDANGNPIPYTAKSALRDMQNTLGQAWYSAKVGAGMGVVTGGTVGMAMNKVALRDLGRIDNELRTAENELRTTTEGTPEIRARAMSDLQEKIKQRNEMAAELGADEYKPAPAAPIAPAGPPLSPFEPGQALNDAELAQTSARTEQQRAEAEAETRRSELLSSLNQYDTEESWSAPIQQSLEEPQRTDLVDGVTAPPEVSHPNLTAWVAQLEQERQNAPAPMRDRTAPETPKPGAMSLPLTVDPVIQAEQQLERLQMERDQILQQTLADEQKKTPADRMVAYEEWQTGERAKWETVKKLEREQFRSKLQEAVSRGILNGPEIIKFAQKGTDLRPLGTWGKRATGEFAEGYGPVPYDVQGLAKGEPVVARPTAPAKAPEAPKPVTDFIAANSGILPKARAPKSASYDGAPSLVQIGGKGMKAIFGTGKITADEMAQMLYDAGMISEPYADTMWEAIRKEHSGAGKVAARQQTLADQMEERAAAEGEKITDRISALELTVGDTFTINGEKFRVTGENDQSLEIKDGETFTMPFDPQETGGMVSIDKGSLKKGATNATQEGQVSESRVPERVGTGPIGPEAEAVRGNRPVEGGAVAEEAKAEEISPAQEVQRLVLQAQKDAGWNPKWPFVPADLSNRSFVEAIKTDPELSEPERAKILSFVPGGEGDKALMGLKPSPKGWKARKAFAESLVGKRVRSYGGGIDTVIAVDTSLPGTIEYTVQDETTGEQRTHATEITAKQVVEPESKPSRPRGGGTDLIDPVAVNAFIDRVLDGAKELVGITESKEVLRAREAVAFAEKEVARLEEKYNQELQAQQEAVSSTLEGGGQWGGFSGNAREVTGDLARTKARNLFSELQKARGRLRDSQSKLKKVGKQKPAAYSAEYLVAEQLAKGAKWLGTKLEGAYRSAVNAVSRGLDYFTWAKDAVAQWGARFMESAREIWRSAVASVKAFVSVPGGILAQRRGAIGAPNVPGPAEQAARPLPPSEAQIKAAREQFGGVKEAEKRMGAERGASEAAARTKYVEFYGRLDNMLRNFGDAGMVAEVLNAVRFSDVLTQQAGMPKKIADKTGRVLGTPLTWEQRESLARWHGRSIGEILGREPGTPLSQIDQTKLKMALENAGVMLAKARLAVHNNPNDTDAKAAQRTLLDAMTSMSAVMYGNATDAARALQFMKSLARPDRNEAWVQEELRRRGEELTQAQVDAINSLDRNNPNFHRNVNNIVSTSLFDVLYEIYLGNILSGLKTMTRNLASNVASLAAHPFETMVAYAVDVVKGEEHGRSLADPIAIGMGWLKSFKDAGRVAWQALIEGDLNGVKLANKAVQLQWNNGEGIGYLKGEGHPRAIGGNIGYWVRMPSNLLRATDVFFRTMASMAHLELLATRAAKMEGLKAGTAAHAKFMADFTTEPPPAALKESAKMGATRVFAEPMTQPAMKSFLQARGNKTFIGRILQLLVPFAVTPYNILMQGLERSPVGFYWAYQGSQKNVENGGISKAQMSDELAKPIMGSIVLGTGAYLVLAGLLTGGGPKDKSEREAWKARKGLPYSIRIGDQQIGLDTIEPLLGTTLAMMADAVEAMMRAPKDKGAEEMIRAGVTGTLEAIAKNIHNKTFLRGLMSATDAMSDPERYGGSFIESYARGAVLASGLMRSFKEFSDPTAYRTDGPSDSFWSVFPVLSAMKLHPQIDWLGRTVLSQPPGTGIAASLWRMAGPVQYARESSDPVDVFARDLNVSKTRPTDLIKRKNMEYRMTPGQHTEYIKMQGERVYRYLAAVGKNLAPRLATMSETARDRLRGVIEKKINKYRQDVLQQLIIKWKKEGSLK